MEKTVQDNFRQLKEKAAPLLDKLVKNSEQARDKAIKYIRANPGKSLAGAATAGFVTALIARRIG